MSWSNTIEQPIQNPDPLKYLTLDGVREATGDGTKKGTEFQFYQTTKNIDKSDTPPEQLFNNEKIPERCRERYTALLGLNPEKDQLIQEYMETIPADFAQESNKNNTDFELMLLLLEETTIQEFKTWDKDTKARHSKKLRFSMQIEESLTFIKKILRGKIDIPTYKENIKEINENPETSNTEKAEKAKEYSHETIKKATEVEEILYCLDPKSEDFTNNVTEIIQVLTKDEKYKQQLIAKGFISNGKINLQKIKDNKPENIDPSIGKSIIEMIKKEQATIYLEKANTKNKIKSSDELYNFVGKTLENVSQKNPLVENTNDILQTDQRFINEMFKNAVFVNKHLPKLIEDFKKKNQSLLLEQGYTPEDLQKLSIQNLKALSQTKNHDEENSDYQKQEGLRASFFSTIINEDTLTNYADALYQQSRGKNVNTWSAFKNTKPLSQTSLKGIDKFSSPKRFDYSKEVTSSNDNKKNETLSTSSQSTVDLSSNTWVDLITFYAENNEALKKQIKTMDTNFHDDIAKNLKEILPGTIYPWCKKKLENNITQRLNETFQKNYIKTNTNIQRTDIISEEEFLNRLKDTKDPSLNFDKLDEICKNNNIAEESQEELKNQITEEIKKTIAIARETLEKKGLYDPNKLATNIEARLNKQTIGNIIDQISKTLDENESTKGFSIDLTDKESFKIDDKYIILKGKYGESECSFFYELSSGEVKVSSSFTNDENQINFSNKTPNITICKFPNFKEYKEIWLNSMKGLEKKIQKGDEGKYLQKQFNKEIDITKENMETFLLQNEKSKLFTNFINIFNLKYPSLSKEKNPDHYQFFIDVSNAIHTPEEAQQINTFITRIATQKKLIMDDTKEGKNITDTSEIMRKLFNPEKQKDDEKHLHDSQFSQNSLVLLLTHFIRKTTDQSSENGWTINTFRIEDMNLRMESFNNHGDQAIQLAEAQILWKTEEAKTDPQYTAYKNTALTKFLAS